MNELKNLKWEFHINDWDPIIDNMTNISIEEIFLEEILRMKKVLAPCDVYIFSRLRSCGSKISYATYVTYNGFPFHDNDVNICIRRNQKPESQQK